jgi:hypothetical protein
MHNIRPAVLAQPKLGRQRLAGDAGVAQLVAGGRAMIAQASGGQRRACGRAEQALGVPSVEG